MPPNPPRRIDPAHTSSILRSLLDSAAGEYLTMGEIVDALGGRGFGILLVLFGLLNAIPAPVPGLSTVLGAPLLILSWQVTRGLQHPWLPKRLAQRRIARTQLVRLANAARRIRPFERLFKPRLNFLVTATAQRFLGLACLLMSILIVLPIWMGNWPPAIGIVFFGLAIAKGDGVAAILGIVAGAAALAIVTAVLLAALHAFNLFV